MAARIGRNQEDSVGVHAGMRRLPALALAVFVALALVGCSVDLQPGPSAVPSATASPTPDLSIGPAPTPEAFALVSIESKGGECATGLCTRLVNIEGDGRLHEVIPKDHVIGTVPEDLLDALRARIEQADYRQIRSKPFTGTCPTAYDGQQVIYTFHVTTGDREIDACKVAIDPKDPLFVTLNLAIRAAGG
ncbi:MAG TPA: hypothetical protein VH440_13740 [Candidatus Limnocylindrales bacterium]